MKDQLQILFSIHLISISKQTKSNKKKCEQNLLLVPLSFLNRLNILLNCKWFNLKKHMWKPVVGDISYTPYQRCAKLVPTDSKSFSTRVLTHWNLFSWIIFSISGEDHCRMMFSSWSILWEQPVLHLFPNFWFEKDL